jgi:cell division protein ZapA (FtsZ GTPase activity inhibitor)
MQVMSELIPVTVLIGDRTYRLKVDPKDEEVLRKTVKTINEKIIEYKTQFAGKDMQDYVAMALIWFATEQTVAATQQVENENLAGQLDTIERILEKQLKANEAPGVSIS